jgi:hypothetical protein
MYPAPASTPQPDATPVPIGRRTARRWAVAGAVCAVLAAIGAYAMVIAATDMVQTRSQLFSFSRSALLLLFGGVLAFICLRVARSRRDLAISTDFTGLWLTDGDARAVIPWNDVAAVGLHEYVVTQTHSWPNLTFTSWSIDLRLHEPVEPGDPLLDRMALPAGPPRYMIRLPHGTHIDAMAAIKARVPELWLEAPHTD